MMHNTWYIIISNSFRNFRLDVTLYSVKSVFNVSMALLGMEVLRNVDDKFQSKRIQKSWILNTYLD